MKNRSNKVSDLFDHLATHRAQRQARAQLAHELAGFDSPAERLELEMIFSRYPDEQTQELRTILGRQAVRAA